MIVSVPNVSPVFFDAPKRPKVCELKRFDVLLFCRTT
jgi:hypothetical protein